jgi:hypothetical protein
MTQIVIDATLRSKLQDLTQPLEFLDEQGQVLGRYVPAGDLPAHLTEEPQLTEEEWRRLEQETETYSTADVVAHLEKL